MDIHMQCGNSVQLGDSRFLLRNVGDNSAEFTRDGDASVPVTLGNYLQVEGFRVQVESGPDDEKPVLLRVPSKLYARLERK